MGDQFGVAISPFELAEWQAATGITPDMCMVFENWSRQRPLTDTLNKARSLGHKAIAVTWEPWTPTPVGSTPTTQGSYQPQWSHRSILAGAHNDYIDEFARALRDSDLTIYLRYAHEMNGNWYPWRNSPDLYIEAWKYLRNRIRSQRGAWNVQLVWSPNPDLWRTNPADWLLRLLPYWPGPAAVDYVGFTMIEFGTADKHYPISSFAERFDLSRRIFQKPILAMEVNVARERAITWLSDLTAYVSDGTRPLPLVVLSQGASRAAALGGTGTLDWSPVSDRSGQDAIKALCKALHSN